MVALFDRFTGDAGGAPYIPVRFGAVRLTNSGVTIKRAVVEIERISANSIKAKFRFFGKNGEVVAAFDDCRFRRTYLRQHKTLDMLSFHYEAVPSDRATAAWRVGPAEGSASTIACGHGRKRHRQYDAAVQTRRSTAPAMKLRSSSARERPRSIRGPFPAILRSAVSWPIASMFWKTPVCANTGRAAGRSQPNFRFRPSATSSRKSTASAPSAPWKRC